MAERARRAPNVCAAGARLLSCACLLLGCDGDFVNLGTSERMLNGGDTGAGAPNVSGSAGSGGSIAQVWSLELDPVLAQSESVGFANPTFTTGGELYFTSLAHQGSSPEPAPPLLKLARRTGAAFGSAIAVQVGDSDASMFAVASPAVSYDGSELWLSLAGTSGDTDVFHSARQGNAWQKPELVSELRADGADDAVRPPAVGGTLIPLSSKRASVGGKLFQIFLSERPSPDAPWNEPSQALLGTINSPDFQSADGFLSADGLQLFFSSTRGGDDADLYVARRSSLSDAFGEPELLLDLKSDYNERMPWVSAAGDELYFASDRPTPAFQEYAIYRATKR